MLSVKKDMTVIRSCFFACFVNLVLCFTKLYVSLSANSVSIFSDAVNNAADSLSCVLSAVFTLLALKALHSGAQFEKRRLSHLLSFVLAAIVFTVGVSFAVSSLERLMYPSPVWFSYGYFIAIFITVLIKAFLFLFFSKVYQKTASPVLRVMKTDSLTDCCITAVTLVSFTLTRYTEFAADAFAGLFVSVFILVQSVILMKESVSALIDIIPKKTKNFFESALCKAGIEWESIRYESTDESITAYISISQGQQAQLSSIFEKLKNIEDKTGVLSKLVVQ